MNLPPYRDKYIAYYCGEGYLIFEDDQRLDCAFEACQLINGKIFLLCKFNSFTSSILAWEQPAYKFKGRVSTGYLIVGSENITPKRFEGNSVLYLITSLYITGDGNKMAAKIVFGLTNLELDNLELHLSLRAKSTTDQKVTLRPVNDYKNIIYYLDVFNDINVTYEAIIEINRDENIQQIEQMIQDLCYLLSIACGTKINWIYLDKYSDINSIISRYHYNRITKRYSSSALIPKYDVKKFIESTYPTYAQKRDAYKLDKGLIDSYLDARSQEDYTQLRAVKLAVTMEFLKSLLIDLQDFHLKEYIIDKDDFENRIAPLLCEKINEIFTNNISDKNILERFDCVKSINCINRTSFRTILKSFCKSVQPSLNKDVPKFINSRNSLIHNLRFYCELSNSKFDREDKTKEYYFIVNFINILILRLLDYRGDYLDCRNILKQKKSL